MIRLTLPRFAATAEGPAPRFTGRKFALCMGGAFLTIVCANTALIVAAAGSFPGLVVKNSYVASQDFEARRSALAASGLSLAPDWSEGRLSLAVSDTKGQPVPGMHVTATIGRPTFHDDDRLVILMPEAGGYGAALGLEPGRWQANIVVSPADAGADTQPITLTHRFTIRH
ncbi:MAG: FixH family protein [Pseudomonadota bacterium]